jgi:protein phosphatase
VGPRSEVYPDVRTEALLPGDVVLLCTDGVYEEMTEQEIADVVLKIGPKPQRICDRLISLAQDRGGRDDSTVLVLTYDN